MKKWITTVVKINVGVFAVFSLVFAANAFAETPEEKGQAIMEKIDQMPMLEKVMSENAFHIYDAQGKKIFSKKARTATFTNDFRDHVKRLNRIISYFYAPADDKGNGALMIEVADKDDDQWIYLKGLRKPKRIIGSDKSSSFMGSDFSNGDMAAKDIGDSHYTWLGTETISFKGKDLTVEKIQAVFKDPKMSKDYGLSKAILYLHVKSGLPFKIDNYDLNGQLEKRAVLLSFAVRKNKDGEKVYIPTSLEMKNVIKGTKTIMEMSNIMVEDAVTKVTPDIFKVDYLTRKWW